MLVYIVESDVQCARRLGALLEQANHEVDIFANGASALRRMRERSPDVAVVDYCLPDMEGLEVLGWIRHYYSNTPVMMLGNAALEYEVVRAFEAGADDLMPKPPRELELVARMQAIARRAGIATAQRLIRIGHYTVDRKLRLVSCEDRIIRLTSKEYDVFDLLAVNLGRVISRRTLASQIWGRSADLVESRTLDSHICRLRHKLQLNAQAGVNLRVVYGHGYQLEQTPVSSPAIPAAAN